MHIRGATSQCDDVMSHSLLVHSQKHAINHRVTNDMKQHLCYGFMALVLGAVLGAGAKSFLYKTKASNARVVPTVTEPSSDQLAGVAEWGLMLDHLQAPTLSQLKQSYGNYAGLRDHSSARKRAWITAWPWQR